MIVTNLTKEMGDKASGDELEIKNIISEIKTGEKLDLKLHP